MPIDPDAVLAGLSLEQKVSLLAGADTWHTVELPGMPRLRTSDGPAGVRGTQWRGPASASFPCGTALGASFDPALVEEVGAALGREARSKSAQVLLAPTVNLHRTPIGGRNFECMSEDPVLTAGIAAAYIRGVQSEGVAACVKHFVANDTEHERMTISSEVDERTLRELYLVPFERAVRPAGDGGGGVRVVMSSYNRVNGTYAAEHRQLLREVLRDEWGFDGVVVSDWYGTHEAAASLEAGVDLEMPGPARVRGEQLLAAVRAGEVAEARVDESVRRLLELLRWCGVGDEGRGWDPAGPETTDDSPATREVVRRAGVAGTVLLVNDQLTDGARALPIPAGRRIALIGPHAEKGQVQGGGSARVRPHRPVGLLEAMRARGAEVDHHRGCSVARHLPPVRGTFTVTFTGEAPEGGGPPPEAVVPLDRLLVMVSDDPGEGIERDALGLTVAGTFTPEVSGEWEVGMLAVGAAVLRVDGEVAVDLSVPQDGGSFFGQGSPEVRATVVLEAGVPCRLEVSSPFQRIDTTRGISVGAAPVEVGDPVADAAAVAAGADVAVVVVGTTDEWETEGEDRTTMALPGRQDELVAAVAAANPNTVVVVNAGSPVTMPWLGEVAAVAQVWFPGGEIGNVVADVLLGLAEPGGRLPMTIPRRLEDTPAFLSHPGDHGVARYTEGLFVGYRWYDARDVEPLFPFGHGLGYTTWSYGAATVTGSVDEGVTVVVPVTNTGLRPGTTVVQCYVSAHADGPRRPPRELAAFAKVHAEPGATVEATLAIGSRAFATWHPLEHRWHVAPGAYRLCVGPSSRELVVAGSVIAG